MSNEPNVQQEEIREIERKSSLLASAIDETIKSIEEYKEEVGIDTKKEVTVQKHKEEKVTKSYQESYSKEVNMESKQNGFAEIESQIENIIEQCNALDTIDNGNSQETDTKMEASKEFKVEIKQESIEAEPIPIQTETEVKRKSVEKTVQFENDIKEEGKAVAVVNVNDQRTAIQTMERVADAAPVNVKQSVDMSAEKLARRHARTPELKVERMKSVDESTEKSDALLGFRPVVFEPETIPKPQCQANQYVAFQVSITKHFNHPLPIVLLISIPL